MKHLWKVEFEVKFTGYGEWMGDETFTVMADGDGLNAVAKARKLAMKRSFEDTNKSETKDIVRRAVNCRLVGLKRLDEIQA
jgi:hypothetical protein